MAGRPVTRARHGRHVRCLQKQADADMVSKTTDKWDAKRKQILDIAEGIFSEKGYKGTRLQDIADILGMQRPSLLYYFKNKLSLLDAVIGGVTQRFADVVTAHIRPGDDIDGIYPATDSVCEFLIANPSCARIIARQATDPQFPRSESSTEPIRSTIRLIEECATAQKGRDASRKYVYYFLSQIFLTVIWVSMNNATKRSMDLDLLSPQSLAFLRGTFQRLRLDTPPG